MCNDTHMEVVTPLDLDALDVLAFSNWKSGFVTSPSILLKRNANDSHKSGHCLGSLGVGRQVNLANEDIYAWFG